VPISGSVGVLAGNRQASRPKQRTAFGPGVSLRLPDGFPEDDILVCKKVSTLHDRLVRDGGGGPRATVGEYSRDGQRDAADTFRLSVRDGARGYEGVVSGGPRRSSRTTALQEHQFPFVVVFVAQNRANASFL
jgi:hypothetical protein